MSKTVIKHKLILVSAGIRRDLHQPLKYFRKLRVFHLYQEAAYQDMRLADFYNPRAIKFSSMLDLYKKVSNIQPDILQTAEPWANQISLKITLVCFWYSLFHSVKMIFPVFENRPLDKKFSLPFSSILRLWVRILSRRCQKIFYLNQGAGKNLIESGVSEKKLQRANWGTWGIDIQEFKSDQTKAWKKFYQPTILFVGKVSRAKGIPWLLNAFKRVKKTIPKVRLLIVGPVENKELVRKFKQFSGVKFVGPVKNQFLPGFFKKVVLTVVPSITTRQWEEQVGMVNLQSMACGTPVVSTRSGAIPEYIKDRQGCLLVAEKNADVLARAIVKFLTDKKFYSRQSRRAQTWVRENYEVKQNVKKLEKILISILN